MLIRCDVESILHIQDANYLLAGVLTQLGSPIISGSPNTSRDVLFYLADIKHYFWLVGLAESRGKTCSIFCQIPLYPLNQVLAFVIRILNDRGIQNKADYKCYLVENSSVHLSSFDGSPPFTSFFLRMPGTKVKSIK